ncbi:MAG: hypothetical protein JXB45_08640 [Candidatus Krumholzibacteriota bacterium]|nr:hypothetical protein [Candidatus Krumholzibacteriota bacterium]
MEKKHADIDQVLATFSDHLSKSYPAPGQFQKNLDQLLAAKKQRLSAMDYTRSLEKNTIFLHDLILEGEGYLEVLLGRINDDHLTAPEVEAIFGEMESQVRSAVEERHRRVFGSGEGKDEILMPARQEYEGDSDTEKLEFSYFYYLVLRIFLFEFFNVLLAVREDYIIDRIDAAAGPHVLNHVKMNTNYYLENISVGEIVTGGREKKEGGER